MSKFIILCGGTGGHLAPGIAVGQALIKAGHKASFVISRKEVDSRLMSKYTELDVIKAPGAPFSKNPLGFIRFLKELIASIRLGRKILSEGKYDVLISFGGFNSLGFSIAAIMKKIPVVVHEANRRAGKATKFLGKFAERIYVPHGVRIRNRDVSRIKCAGYPIRDEIKKLPSEDCKKKFGFSANSTLLLVLGGSQGAKSLNDWCIQNFQKLAEENIDVLCVCGQGKLDLKESSYTGSDGKEHTMKCLEFCDDMGSAMSAADLVVARAGAGSIAEFARCGLPSIIVPYPFAADNHQVENAKCFERQGACVTVFQSELDRLLPEVLQLAKNETLKTAIRKNLRRVDDLNDMSKIVEDLARIAEVAKLERE